MNGKKWLLASVICVLIVILAAYTLATMPQHYAYVPKDVQEKIGVTTGLLALNMVGASVFFALFCRENQTVLTQETEGK